MQLKLANTSLKFLFFFKVLSVITGHKQLKVPPKQNFKSHENVSSQFIPEIPEQCMESTYCEDVQNYPEEYVTTLLSKLHIKDIRLFEEEAPSHQMIGDDDDLPMCPTTSSVTVPRAAKNKQDEWFFVINLKDNPLQVVRQTKCYCKSPDKCQCKFLKNKEISVCKQVKIEKMLLTIDRRGRAVSMTFPFDCCCSCYVYTSPILGHFALRHLVSH